MDQLMTLAKENGFFPLGAGEPFGLPAPALRAGDVRGGPLRAVRQKTGPARRPAGPWPGQRRRFADAAAVFWCRPPVPWPMNLITRVCSAWPGSTKKPLKALPGRPGCCIRTAWPLTAGACTLCRRCTCPSAPCRYPARRLSSMEAYGLWVSDICRQSGLEYNYGAQTMTYTACVLCREE